MTSDKFPPSSRYHDIEVATVAGPDGRAIAYLRRRFVPQPERFALLREHVVRAGERWLIKQASVGALKPLAIVPRSAKAGLKS